MELARSLMFVPGHEKHMVEKAFGLASLDVALLDLEDGVPPAEKDAARGLVADALGRLSASRPSLIVRINGLASEHFIADIAAIVRPGLRGIVLPKAERAEDLVTADRLVAERERSAGIRAQSVPFIPSIESAAGLLNAAVIAKAPRVAGLMFGAEDWANDLGLPTDRAGQSVELLYVRSAIAVAAAAARIVAFDGIWPRIEDADGLRGDALQARQLGFSGKTCIHPSQIDVVNEVFTPSEREVEHARRVVAAFEDAQLRGSGAVAVSGQMIDRPVVERARRVLRAWELTRAASAGGGSTS